jgi:hypothetical protein
MPFVDPVMVIVPEEWVVFALSSVVERILDSLWEFFGFRNAKDANSDDFIAEITPTIANDLDIVVFHPQLMVVVPSK